MKMNKKVLFIAIIVALLVTGLTYYYINFIALPAAQSADAVDYVQVVTATDDIPAYTTITDEMLTYVSIPAEYVNEEAIQSKEDIIGGMTNTALVQGEQVLSSRVVTDDDASADLSYQIDENMRAITISVSEITGVAGYITVGDKIDLLMSYSGDIYTELQNIEVIALGNQSSGSSSDYSSLTLMVTPEEAQVVAYAIQNASIQCTLRNPSDDVIVDLNVFGATDFSSWIGN